MYIEILQTALLLILVDRSLILRDRYKIAVENDYYYPDNKRYMALWIYCKKKENDFYERDGGRRLIWFRF